MRDLIFPDFCRACGAIAKITGVCHSCLNGLNYISKPCICGVELEYGSLCPKCRRQKPVFSRLVSAFRYETPVKELLHSFKYRHEEYLIDTIFDIAKPAIERNIFLTQVSSVVPVPMHFFKKLWRRYNHAELIALKISKEYGLKLDVKLLKRKFTRSQVKLKADARLKNMEDAFYYRGKAPQKILLVDDVATTLSTLNSASRALKEAGAKTIYCFTIAREF